MDNNDANFNVKAAINFLLKSFKVERYIYLCVTLLSIVLLGILVFILFRKQDFANIMAMLGPAGLITFSFSRVLKMWTDCIDLIKTYLTKK